ncbi:hypothetical protein HYPSUDRAFT_207945 [Hypholoma sublateritium FD-334 SS-4]|uniref:Uncharacterized protein n=1 Tax=Hypholoma sublateritium (strain FD-334 SS-4) TaxID=945553 RepID=A0A0D2LWV4_HYPSF|nr:hypothetical protein HYPSUDRAFT_207945 [Hypholoma sublateritium FD-334 SS-4]
MESRRAFPHPAPTLLCARMQSIDNGDSVVPALHRHGCRVTTVEVPLLQRFAWLIARAVFEALWASVHAERVGAPRHRRVTPLGFPPLFSILVQNMVGLVHEDPTG